MRAESFRSHAGALDFRANFGGQSGAEGLDRVVGDTSERGIVSRVLSAIDVAMSVGKRMRLGTGGDHVQQKLEAVLRLDTAEIRTVRAEFAKEGLVMGGDSLADDGDSEARRGRRLRRHNRAQTISVGDRGDSKGVELVSGPEMRRELFHELRGSINPIGILKLSGKTNLREALQPLFDLIGGERIQISKFFFQGATLGGKLEIVFDNFPQQARQKAQRQASQRGNVFGDQFSGLRRIAIELLRFEVGWKHTIYKSSGTGLPCASEAENRSMEPRVGTRSVDSIGRSKTTPSRTPAPKAIIHVVRESASPVR